MKDTIKNRIYTVEKADNKTMLGKLNEIYNQFKGLNINLEDIYNEIKSGQLKGDKGDQGEQGVGVQSIEIVPETNGEHGMTYKMETTYTNGNTENSGDFIVPKGDQGEQGVGIQEVADGVPEVNGEYTFTPVEFTLTNGNKQTINITAKNGSSEGGIKVYSISTGSTIDLDTINTTSIYNSRYSFYMNHGPVAVASKGQIITYINENEYTQYVYISTSTNFYTGYVRMGTVSNGNIVSNTSWLTLSNSDPVGTIKAFVGTTIPTDYLKCDGSTFMSAVYPELYNILGSNTLPNLNGRMLEGTTNNNDLKKFVNAGLPNIKGTFSFSPNDNVLIIPSLGGDTTGAFNDTFNISNNSAYTKAYADSGANWSGYKKVGFSAHESNNIYSDGVTTVQPNTYKVMFIIKAR